MSKLRLTWQKGGEAELVETDGNIVSFLSTTAAPPGTPLSGLTEAKQQFQVKVRGCRKAEDGRFLIDGRFFNLTKQQRQLLLGED